MPHRPRRSLGQNFLIDANIQRRIIDAIDAGADDEVLEIGPGMGALTDRLAGNVRRLIAVELDRNLAAGLQDRFADRDDVDIRQADILDSPLESLTDEVGKLLVAGNIPYNITSPIVFHLLQRPRPARIVLMVQREVAERITARPGTSEYGALSVGVQTVASADRLFNVARTCFRPVPNVDSAVLRITPTSPPQLTRDEERDLRSLTSAAFGWRRKQLQKTLRAEPRFLLDPDEVQAVASRTSIQLQRRPETLTPDEFINLSRALRRIGRPRPSA